MRDRLLTRHFLQRFLDHDLISPHADRHEVLAITCAMIVVSSLFLSFFLSLKYQFNVFLPPGLTSTLALDDRFFLASLAMIVMALVAVAEWDALVLDARDTAVLGPLPIDRWTIVRAKFVAVILLAAGFDAALALGPTVLRAWALPVKLPVTMIGALELTLAQAACSLASGAFGFVAVLAIRETIRALIGPAAFNRMSAALQAALGIILTTMLLLLPRSAGSVAATWLSHGRVPPAVVPPLWFVGLHETVVGGVVDGLPRSTPLPRYVAAERTATHLYQAVRPLFPRLAEISVIAMMLVFAAAIVASLWNNRRLPAETFRKAAFLSGMRRAVGRGAAATIVRHPAAQAGFSFTLQSLARSVPHRATMGVVVAVAVSLVVITSGAVDTSRVHGIAAAPLSALTLQTLILAVALTAFRHIVRVPAELRANWTFHLAWSGDERPFLAGVKRAALTVIVAPTLAILFLYGAFAFGPRFALGHLVAGVLLSWILIDLLFIGYRKLPFASSYIRSEDLKSVGPLYVLAALTGTVWFAEAERAAFGSVTSAVLFFGALVALGSAAHALDASRRRLRLPIDLDERPAGSTQPLELIR